MMQVVMEFSELSISLGESSPVPGRVRAECVISRAKSGYSWCLIQ